MADGDKAWLDLEDTYGELDAVEHHWTDGPGR